MEGIFQTQAEIDALDAAAQAATGDADAVYQSGAQPGRIRFADRNGDGVNNADDAGVIGNPHPDFTAGLSLRFEYKRFDFDIFLFGSFGNDIYNYNKAFTDFHLFNSNVSQEVYDNAWRGEGTSNSIPRIDGSDSFSRSTSSSYFVEDGTFVRARTISLGYNLPGISKIGLEKLRLYVQIQNAFTITDYSGIDPELSNVNVGQFNNDDQTKNNDSWTGFDFGNYPASRVFMFGLNATF
jgi:hypothetical protein